MQLIARQRDEVLRGTYASEVAIHCSDMFIFLALTTETLPDIMLTAEEACLLRLTSCWFVVNISQQ